MGKGMQFVGTVSMKLDRPGVCTHNIFMMKLTAITFIIVLVSYGILFFDRIKAETHLPCTQCQGRECDVTYGTCYYGTYRNLCGQLECSRGPNQTCGGLFDARGRCGDGLSCRCNVCTGCSTDTLECYYKHCKEDLSPITRLFHYPPYSI
ncbi:neuroparsin-A-like [Arctopsyche grandis]|uniref:neuroparsin-A-like n=1 Tax=Arctopsyche grandis TaxID=121162 RepID=UPI00406D926B